jgi:hypothetical protein
MRAAAGAVRCPEHFHVHHGPATTDASRGAVPPDMPTKEEDTRGADQAPAPVDSAIPWTNTASTARGCRRDGFDGS